MRGGENTVGRTHRLMYTHIGICMYTCACTNKLEHKHSMHVHQICTTIHTHPSPPPPIRWFYQKLPDCLVSTHHLRTCLWHITPTWWTAVLCVFIGSFLLSCVNQFAQAHAQEQDALAVRRMVEDAAGGKKGQ